MSEQEAVKGYTPENQSPRKYIILDELVSQGATATNYFRVQAIGVFILGLGALLGGAAMLWCVVYPAPVPVM